MKVNTKYVIWCYFFEINLIIYSIWWFFVAIEPIEPPVEPMNQWAIHFIGSLAGLVF
jgi:hypothetical protein